jgi:hypothetical protein
MHLYMFLEELVRVMKVGSETLGRSNIMQATIPGLLRGTRYAISLSCFNSAGSGPSSTPVYHNTPQGGKNHYFQ